MKLKRTFLLTLTLTVLIVSSLSILPCFAQYAASTQLKTPERWEGGFSLRTVVFSPDGRTIIGGFGIGSVHFWDVSTGEIIRTLPRCSDSNIALSPDGHTLVSSGHESSKEEVGACVWNASTGLTLYALEESWEEAQGNQVNDIAFSPDGRTIANGVQDNQQDRDGFVRLWDASTGKTIRKLEHPSNVIEVAFSPDGETLVSWGGGGIIRFWDVSTGEIVRTIENMWSIKDLIFSPDGGTLAIMTGVIRLWDVSTGKIVRMLQTGAGVVALAFNPCGGTLASAHSVENIHVWDVSTGQILHTFEGHTSNRFEDDIVGIAFSQDGGTLLSVNVQGTVLQWDMVPCKPERLPEDVNGDGVVNIQDLVAVADALGETGETPADVNGDGIVNIQDLVAVAAAFGEIAANAPSAANLSAETVQQWLSAANQLGLTDTTSQRGIRLLEQLLLTLTPKETALLANYPNPFNPETWIPYQLAKSADVTLRIHAVDGTLVRTLSLGHKATGIYQSRSRAAYWDSKNEVGEPIASGVYFYTLTAGDFAATRKMLIRK